MLCSHIYPHCDLQLVWLRFLGAGGIKDVATILAIGQMTELIFIPLIPYVIRKIGIKYAMLVGMVTWGARYLVLIIATGGNVAWAIAAVALHGICSDFFAVTGVRLQP